MIEYMNPFEYEQATKLKPMQVLEYFIEDFSYARFINSRRNIFLVGERGTGKTMTFRHYSLPLQLLKLKNEKKDANLTLLSIYVTCNTPLTHRKEHELLSPLPASIISEHFLVTSIMDAIMESVSQIDNLFLDGEESSLRSELEYMYKVKFPDGVSLPHAFRLFLNKCITEAQENLSGDINGNIVSGLFSFNSGIRPLLSCLTNLRRLNGSHFSFMIDDAQLLNEYQIRALNSWIAYRDNSIFSFKVATTRIEAPPRNTSSGGNILEGHDFISIDMEQPYQNKVSAFGKLAKEIIARRIESIKLHVSPDEYFPEHSQFQSDLEVAKEQARIEANEKYPGGTAKQISDYIYKYTRAIYFRDRSKRANTPQYSGFELLVHLSTGVIRNLLDPCYHMYDRMYSELSQSEKNKSIDHIPANIQSEIIIDRSRKKWEWIRDELHNSIEGCSYEMAKRVYRLMDNLAILFKKRLESKIREPRAVVFTISDLSDREHKDLLEVIKVARKAQVLYTYTSAAKDSGKKEIYYVPNRILWPFRGLDPQGQHARVSIRATHLQNAAIDDAQIPFVESDSENEPDLFNYEN